MTKFRPCIDLHEGKVKQIVGGTLSDSGDKPTENFVSDRSAEWYADLYCQSKLTGGHVIQLGKGNADVAQAALSAWRGGLQIGGGINVRNAASWLEAGASHIIVTSWLFVRDGVLLERRLRELEREVGREHIVLDMSCRRSNSGWTVAMDRWQKLTNIDVTNLTLDTLAEWCSEYLIHAADVEGLCQGVDTELVDLLGAWAGIPMTYAGGVRGMEDLQLVHDRSGGSIDVTVGSALDIFGGNGVTYDDLLNWNNREI